MIPKGDRAARPRTAGQKLHWAKGQTRTRVGVVTPAEDALVGTGQGGGGLHAPVGLNAIEAMLVTATPPAQHGLGPAAQLHPTVGACTMQHFYCMFLIKYMRSRVPEPFLL